MKRNFSGIMILLSSILLLMLSLVLTAYAADIKPLKGKAMHFRFASHVLGGTGYTQAALLANTLRPYLPEGSTIDVLPYSGGVGNILLVEQGKAEFATTGSNSDKWAWDGKVGFDKKYRKLRYIAAADLFYWVCYATNKSGITSLEEAFKAKKPINWNALNKGSSGELGTRLILQAYGASYEKIKEWRGTVINTEWGNIQPALKDGRADIVSHFVGGGHPSMTEIALLVPGRFLDLKEPVRDLMASEYGYEKSVMPPNTFNNQPDPIKTLNNYNVITCSVDVPDEVVYILAKIMAEQRGDLIKGHASFASVPPQTVVEPGKRGVPFHPGAERYYRERGWLK